MNRSILWTLAAVACGAVMAQQPASLIAEAKQAYTSVKNNLIRAAEKMPEDAYNFKPTPELQSFGERVAHVANQIRGCGAVLGEQKQSSAAGKTAKADLVAALKESFDVCDKAWDSMNDKTAMETIAGRGGQRTKLGSLVQNTMHIDEVYGTMTVYMRLKGLVPPSSEGGGARGGR